MNNYFYEQNGEQYGPVVGEQLTAHGVHANSLVWGHGMTDWAPADTVEELRALFYAVPPQLPQPAAPTEAQVPPLPKILPTQPVQETPATSPSPPFPVMTNQDVSPQEKRNNQLAEVEKEELNEANEQLIVDFIESERKRMFKALFSFKGRIRRKEFWLSIFMYNGAIIIFYLKVLGANADKLDSEVGPFMVVSAIFSIIMFWLTLAQGAKRCHDRGNSGVYQLIPFYIFWMLFAPGDTEDNRYGTNPK